MFRCNLCGKNSVPGEQPVRAPVEYREVTYPKRYDCHRGVPGNDDSFNDPGGKGREIVKEIIVHEACFLDAQAEAHA